MAEPLFIEPVNFMVPAGFREVIRDAAQSFGNYLLHLVHGIHCCDVVGSRLREGRHAAGLVGIPRQILFAAAVMDHAVIPFAFQHFGSDTRG